MIWLQSAQSSSSCTTHCLNPRSMHTLTKLRECNHVASLSRFWEFAVHSSRDMRGVEQPSFHLLGGGCSESVKCICLYSHNTLHPDAWSAKMSCCLCEGVWINNRGHWDVQYTVRWSEWTLTFAGVLSSCMWAVSCRCLNVSLNDMLYSKLWYQLPFAPIQECFGLPA